MRWLESNRNIGTLVLVLGAAHVVLYAVGLVAGEGHDGYMGVAGCLAVTLGLVLRHYNPPEGSEAPPESGLSRGVQHD